MICFPNAKINLGLFVTGKRSDGFHTIESIFYPVPLKDALEAVISKKTSFTQSGIDLAITPEENLVMKAYTLMSEKYKTPALDIYLKKAIPPGAGLGGGSADAAFMLKMLNELNDFPVPENELLQMAESLGADCPFFIRNMPVTATGTGNVFHPSDISLQGYTLCIVKPPFSISTKEAYTLVKPQKPLFSLQKLSSIPVHEWKYVLFNDFEPSQFKKYPIIKKIKDCFYAMGAEYASMSGSGSAVFGLFNSDAFSPAFDGCFKNNTFSSILTGCFVWKGTLE